jgi:hypothetical protein
VRPGLVDALSRDALSLVARALLDGGHAVDVRAARLTCHALRDAVDAELASLAVGHLNEANAADYKRVLERAGNVEEMEFRACSVDACVQLVRGHARRPDRVLRLTILDTYGPLPIARTASTFSMLQALSIHGQHDIHALPSLPEGLRHLRVSDAGELADVVWGASSCVETLRTVSFKACPALRQELLDALLQHAPRLERVTLEGLGQLRLDTGRGAAFGPALRKVKTLSARPWDLAGALRSCTDLRCLHVAVSPTLEDGDPPPWPPFAWPGAGAGAGGNGGAPDVTALLAGMPRLRYVVLAGCGATVRGIAGVPALAKVRRLELGPEEVPTDGGWLRRLACASHVAVDAGCASLPLRDLLGWPCLRRLRLTRVTFSPGPALSATEAVAGCALHTLALHSCDRLHELPDLATCCPRLRRLEVSTCTLTELAVPASVEQLELHHNLFLSSVAFAPRGSRLQRLNVSCCSQLADIRSVAGCAALREACLSTIYALEDASPLARAPSLERLHLCHLPCLRDLAGAPLESPAVRDVRVHHVRVESLAFLARCRGLASLQVVSDSETLDVSALAGCPALCEVKLQCRNVRNVLVLGRCPALRFVTVITRHASGQVVGALKRCLPGAFIYVVNVKAGAGAGAEEGSDDDDPHDLGHGVGVEANVLIPGDVQGGDHDHGPEGGSGTDDEEEEEGDIE